MGCETIEEKQLFISLQRRHAGVFVTCNIKFNSPLYYHDADLVTIIKNDFENILVSGCSLSFIFRVDEDRGYSYRLGLISGNQKFTTYSMLYYRIRLSFCCILS